MAKKVTKSALKSRTKRVVGVPPTQKQKQSQSVVVNIGRGPRKPPSLQKAPTPVQRPNVVIPAADRFLPPGYAQPSLADILSALQSGTKGGVVGSPYSSPPLKIGLEKQPIASKEKDPLVVPIPAPAPAPKPAPSIEKKSLQPTPVSSLAEPRATLPSAFGTLPDPTSLAGRPHSFKEVLSRSSYGLSDALNRTLSPLTGLATFLGGTGRLMETPVTRETDGSTPPASIFGEAFSKGSPMPQPPLPKPLPTETEIPLPQQTVFDLMTRAPASSIVPSMGLVPEMGGSPIPPSFGSALESGELSPEEEATFVDVEEPSPDSGVVGSPYVEGIVEEGPSTELPLPEVLPLTKTSASLSSGKAAAEAPLTPLQLLSTPPKGTATVEEEMGTPVRARSAAKGVSGGGRSGRRKARSDFEMYRAQLSAAGEPADDASVVAYMKLLE